MALTGLEAKIHLVKSHPTHDPQPLIIFWSVLYLSTLSIQMFSTLPLPAASLSPERSSLLEGHYICTVRPLRII